MSELQGCPDSRVLGALLAGTLAQVEQDKVQAHVEECDSCQRTLDQLAASSWEQKARDLGAPQPHPPALEEVLRAAQSPGAELETQAFGAAGADAYGYL